MAAGAKKASSKKKEEKKSTTTGETIQVATVDGSVSVSKGKTGRSFSIKGGSPPVLEVTNEYGNSASFSIDARGFDDLWSQLWQFVKDRQH